MGAQQARCRSGEAQGKRKKRDTEGEADSETGLRKCTEMGAEEGTTGSSAGQEGRREGTKRLRWDLGRTRNRVGRGIKEAAAAPAGGPAHLPRRAGLRGAARRQSGRRGHPTAARARRHRPTAAP